MSQVIDDTPRQVLVPPLWVQWLFDLSKNMRRCNDQFGQEDKIDSWSKAVDRGLKEDINGSLVWAMTLDLNVCQLSAAATLSDNEQGNNGNISICVFFNLDFFYWTIFLLQQTLGGTSPKCFVKTWNYYNFFQLWKRDGASYCEAVEHLQGTEPNALNVCVIKGESDNGVGRG